MTMNQNARRVISVTPTVTGVQYSNNDILFDTTEVPLAVGKKGECSKLVSAMISSKSNSLFDIELFFCTVNQSMGTVNAARSVSDSDWATAKVLGRLTLDSSADNYNYGNGRVHNFDRQVKLIQPLTNGNQGFLFYYKQRLVVQVYILLLLLLVQM